VIAHNEGRQPRDLGVIKGPERRNPNRGFQQGTYVKAAQARRAAGRKESERRMDADLLNIQAEFDQAVFPVFKKGGE
jgi:hypothetical protein